MSFKTVIHSARRTKPVFIVVLAIGLMWLPSKSPALKESKENDGSDHEDAHAKVTGAGVRVGVIEAGGGTAATRGTDLNKYHFPGRWKEDLDFSGSTPRLAADPPFAGGVRDHGTLVSDVVASNDADYTGVAKASELYIGWFWNGAPFPPLGNNDYHAIRAAIDWYNRGPAGGPYLVGLFNNSWGAALNNDTGANNFALFFDWFCMNKDAVIVTAAGNSSGQIGMPADAHNVITVGSLYTDFVQRRPTSSYWLGGDNGTAPDIRGKPDIVAPGSDIANDVPGGANSIEMSGTSFAAPHVTGTSALLVEKGLGLPGPAMRNRLAHKAIILNAARKRHINTPVNEYPDARDNAATNAEESDYDYLTAAGALRLGGTQQGGTPKTDEWTPTKWNYDGTLFTTFRPLDDELGTGVLDSERAMKQFNGGEQEEGSVGPIGWNREGLGSSLPDDVYTFNFVMEAGTFITTTLTWDRIVTSSDSDLQVEETDTYANGAPALPDLDLKIFRVGGGLIARSFGIGGAGIGENVEHLHIPVPEKGVYEIHVEYHDAAGPFVNYGLAWWAVAAGPNEQELDHFANSEATFELITPFGKEIVTLWGPTTVVVHLGQLADPDLNGREQVPTEMVFMELHGTSQLVGDIVVTVRPTTSPPFLPSAGEIEEKVDNTPGTLDIPPFTPTGAASSYFNVYFEVFVAGETLHNIDPKYMQTQITYKPPARGETYENPDIIPLYDENGIVTDYAIGPGSHTPTPESIIPTLSEWAVAAMALLLLVASSIVFSPKRGRERAVA